MPQLIQPSKIKIVPRDGELEITININISLDNQGIINVKAFQENKEPTQETEDTELLIPDFDSSLKIDFGKKV